MSNSFERGEIKSARRINSIPWQSAYPDGSISSRRVACLPSGTLVLDKGWNADTDQPETYVSFPGSDELIIVNVDALFAGRAEGLALEQIAQAEII